MTNEEMTRLLPLVRTGDERACEQLWHGLRIPVYTVAVRILDDRYLAEDVTQEVFVRLFRTPPGEEVHSPRAWVFAVTHNTALNMLKSAVSVRQSRCRRRPLPPRLTAATRALTSKRQ